MGHSPMSTRGCCPLATRSFQPDGALSAGHEYPVGPGAQSTGAGCNLDRACGGEIGLHVGGCGQRIAFRGGQAKRAELSAQGNAILAALEVRPFDIPADLEYAKLRLHLERADTPIGPNDMLIAAHALALESTLVTASTGEFSRVPGLAVENWLEAMPQK